MKKLISYDEIITGKEFSLLVDYSKTDEEFAKYYDHIKYFGLDYQYKGIVIPPKFENGEHEIICSLQKFDNLSPIEVIKEMKHMKLRPAIKNELCTFGIVYPELQKQFPIIGLGSYSGTLIPKSIPNGGLLNDLLNGSCDVPCLSWCIKLRGINIDYHDYQEFIEPKCYSKDFSSVENIIGRTILHFMIDKDRLDRLKNFFYLAVSTAF